MENGIHANLVRVKRLSNDVPRLCGDSDWTTRIGQVTIGLTWPPDIGSEPGHIPVVGAIRRRDVLDLPAALLSQFRAIYGFICLIITSISID